jgi:hypothetical protein
MEGEGDLSKEVLSAILEREVASQNRSDGTGGISAWDGGNTNVRVASGLELELISVQGYSST